MSTIQALHVHICLNEAKPVLKERRRHIHHFSLSYFPVWETASKLSVTNQQATEQFYLQDIGTFLDTCFSNVFVWGVCFLFASTFFGYVVSLLLLDARQLLEHCCEDFIAYSHEFISEVRC